MKKSTVLSMAALLAAPALLISGQAGAAETASHTKLTNCVIQEVVPGKDMTGAYVTFVHTGAPVNLKGAEVPDVSPRVELHDMVMNNGVMEMGPLKDLTLKEGERVFKKGGDHVMLFDVKQKPATGVAGEVLADAVVKSVKDVMKDAGMSGHGHHGKHGHHKGGHHKDGHHGDKKH